MSNLIDIDKLFKALEAEGADLSDDENYYNDDMLEGYSRRLLIRIIKDLPREMSAEEYLRQRARMCDSHTCVKCPLPVASCIKFEHQHPENAVAIVQEWEQKHPEEVEEEWVGILAKKML